MSSGGSHFVIQANKQNITLEEDNQRNISTKEHFDPIGDFW